jgi:DNA primase
MDAVEDIKQRLSVEDVVGQYVQLKRAGRNWKGLSPFTNERTPSFMVSPEKQIWHDFSSSRGGDMFTFIMEMEGVDFKGALELLARQAGIDLDQYRQQKGGSSRGKEKERLYQLLELAARFYQVQFSKHREALEYVLKKRAFSKETALEWRLGYSPESGTALADYARQKGFSERELKGAGLSAQRRGGLGDMFRGRIMVPLADAQGRVIGFTARLLRDDPDAPKYINTPATMLYDKSRHVFGLHLAKEAIRKNKYAVIAEGNLDVIASHQAGVRQVVATAGTALTEHQLKTLGRFGPDIRLCFDADRAGLSATERAIPIASKVGVNLGVITISSGKDPDELIRHDASAWQQLIEQPQYAVDWLIERYQKELDITSALGKRQFSDTVLAVVRGLADPVEREHYLGRVGELINVSPDVLRAKLQDADQAQKPRLKQRKTPVRTAAADTIKIQSHLLALALCRPALRGALAPIKPQMCVSDEAKALLGFLSEHPGFSYAGEPPASKEWKPLEDYAKMLSLLYEGLYQGIEDSELQYEATRLQINLIERYVKTQKQRIARELQTADETRVHALLEAVTKLDALLKQNRGGA